MESFKVCEAEIGWVPDSENVFDSPRRVSLREGEWAVTDFVAEADQFAVHECDAVRVGEVVWCVAESSTDLDSEYELDVEEEADRVLDGKVLEEEVVMVSKKEKERVSRVTPLVTVVSFVRERVQVEEAERAV